MPLVAMGEHWAHNAAHITGGTQESCVSINRLGTGCCSHHPLHAEHSLRDQSQAPDRPLAFLLIRGGEWDNGVLTLGERIWR